MRIWIAFCFILSSFQATAAPSKNTSALGLLSVKQVPQSPAIYFRSTDGRMILNNEAFAPAFFTGRYDVGDRLNSNPEAAEEFRLYREWGLWSSILIWGSLATLITYSVIAVSNDHYDPTAGFLVWFVPFLSGAYSGARSQLHLLRAVNLYNGVPSNMAARDPELRFAKGANDFAPSIGLHFDF